MHAEVAVRLTAATGAAVNNRHGNRFFFAQRVTVLLLDTIVLAQSVHTSMYACDCCMSPIVCLCVPTHKYVFQRQRINAWNNHYKLLLSNRI